MDYEKLWFEAKRKAVSKALFGADEEDKTRATNALILLNEVECEEAKKSEHVAYVDGPFK